MRDGHNVVEAAALLSGAGIGLFSILYGTPPWILAGGAALVLLLGVVVSRFRAAVFLCGSYLVLLLLVPVGVATYGYVTATSNLQGGCDQLERPEPICFDEDYRLYRVDWRTSSLSNRFWDWPEPLLMDISDHWLRLLVSVLGPVDVAYTGPYVSRTEAVDLLLKEGSRLEDIQDKPEDSARFEVLQVVCDLHEWNQFRLVNESYFIVGEHLEDLGRATIRNCNGLEEMLANAVVYDLIVGDELHVAGWNNSLLNRDSNSEFDAIILVDRNEMRIVDLFVFGYNF